MIKCDLFHVFHIRFVYVISFDCKLVEHTSHSFFITPRQFFHALIKKVTFFQKDVRAKPTTFQILIFIKQKIFADGDVEKILPVIRMSAVLAK